MLPSENVSNRGLIQASNGATIANNGAWLDQNAFAISITSSGSASTFASAGSYTKTGAATTSIAAHQLER